MNDNPFVYPPFTLPVFEVLARLPVHVVEVGWLALSVAAVMAGGWFFGVRRRWLVALLAWPVFAVGFAVGNVFGFGFLCFALGYRFAAFLVVGGMFKLQSGIPAIWGLRERRFRGIGLGIAVVALLAIATLPWTGLTAWAEWARGLGYFEQTLDRFPALRGHSLAIYFPTALVILLGLGAISVALLRGGRNGLARFGLASIVASPTLYVHGFGLLLPGAMALSPDILWFVFALVPWSPVWLGVAIVGVALLRLRSEDLSAPSGMSEDAADLHPAGGGNQVWPHEPGGT
jgi:hypothetical protein